MCVGVGGGGRSGNLVIGLDFLERTSMNFNMSGCGSPQKI